MRERWIGLAILCAAAGACGDSGDGSAGSQRDAGVVADASPATPEDPAWPADEPLPAAFDFPPWLNMPQQNRIVVSWRSVEPSTGTVRFGTSPAYGQERPSLVEAQLHHVDLGELEPATAYHYEVEIDGTGAIRKGVFTTPGHAEWRFMHFGEFHAPSMSVIVALFTEHIRAFRPHVLVSSGDMADDGDDLEHWRSYFQTSAPWISNVILLPCGSNHVEGDGGNGNLRDLFVLPQNERWYATRYGQVQFLTLDSTFSNDNLDIAVEQPGWLAEQVQAAYDGDDDPAFLVGAWHYPACSSSYRSRASVREWVMTNFIGTFVENGGLDLALVGHDKYYERSTIEGGVVHVQSNVGKRSPSDEGDNRPECIPMATNTATVSLPLFTVSGDRIEATVVDETGMTIDEFTLQP